MDLDSSEFCGSGYGLKLGIPTCNSGPPFETPPTKKRLNGEEQPFPRLVDFVFHTQKVRKRVGMKRGTA
jgi:hypothetical protein